MAVTLEELAKRVHGQVRGDPNVKISGVAPIESAGPADITYIAGSSFLGRAKGVSPGAVIISKAEVQAYEGNALVVDNPHLCFARIATMLHPVSKATAGIHATAVVDKSARVSSSACIGPLSVIEADAVVGDGCYIGPGCLLGRQARLGDRTRLSAQVSILQGCILGADCIVHAGAVIGSDGFGYASDGAKWVKVPQLGNVEIGNHVEIGANTCIDRGALDNTVIEDGVKLDNLIHIAHNVRIGEDTAIAACVGIAGSTIIGKRCRIGGQAGIIGHLEITDDVHIMATSLVTSSITKSGVYSSALKADSVEEWRKNAARLRHLDEMAKRLKKLEQQIQRLSKE